MEQPLQNLKRIKHLEQQLEQHKCLIRQISSGLEKVKNSEDAEIRDWGNYIDGFLQGHCAYGIKDEKE